MSLLIIDLKEQSEEDKLSENELSEDGHKLNRIKIYVCANRINLASEFCFCNIIITYMSFLLVY